MDLLSLLEDDVELPERPQPEPYIPPQTLETEPEPETESDASGNGGIMALIVFLMLGGIGAGVYFKIIKPKQAMNSGGSFTNIDEFGSGEVEFDGIDDDAESDSVHSDGEDISDDEQDEPEDESEPEEDDSDDDGEDSEYI